MSDERKQSFGDVHGGSSPEDGQEPYAAPQARPWQPQGVEQPQPWQPQGVQQPQPWQAQDVQQPQPWQAQDDPYRQPQQPQAWQPQDAYQSQETQAPQAWRPQESYPPESYSSPESYPSQESYPQDPYQQDPFYGQQRTASAEDAFLQNPFAQDPSRPDGAQPLPMPGAPGGPSDPSAPGSRGDGRPERKRRRGVRALAIVGVLLLLMVAGGVGGLFWWRSSLDSNIERFGDPFKAINGTTRPQADPAAGDAMNILLLGSDSRISAGNPNDWKAGAQRTDAIMVLHIPADRKSAQVISIPRDSWVDIPGRGKNKINAGFSFGGPSLMVQTIESVTGVRIDHVVIIDFTGFQHITDALGGVQICVPKKVVQGDMVIQAGCQNMDGETALTYVRQRKTLKEGDFDRVRRQQNWIRAVIRKLASRGTLTNPFKFNDALDALTSATATDNAFTIDVMQDVALSYRGVEPSDVSFFTAPLANPATGFEGKASVVYLDPAQNKLLWQAVRSDKVSDYIAKYQPNLLGENVR